MAINQTPIPQEELNNQPNSTPIDISKVLPNADFLNQETPEPTQTPIPEADKTEVPPVEPVISTSELTDSTAPVTPTFNRGALVDNIQKTLKTSPRIVANDPFVSGALKLAGIKATPENIAKYSGKRVGDIITELGIGGEFENFGIQEPEPTESDKARTAFFDKAKTEGEEDTKPKSAAEMLNDLTDEADDIADGAELSEAGLEAQVEIGTLTEELNNLTQTYDANKALASVDAQDLKDQFEQLKDDTNIGATGRSIILGESAQAINDKLFGMNSQQVRDLATYTLKTIPISNAILRAQGEYKIAADQQKASSESMRWAFEQKLKIAERQDQITKDQAIIAQQEFENEVTLADDGFVEIPEGRLEQDRADIASGLKDGVIVTNPSNGKSYWRSATAGDASEVLSVSDAKSLGVPYGTTKGQAMALGIDPSQTDLLGGMTDDQRKELARIRTEMRSDQDIKGFVTIRDSLARVEASAKDASAAGDLALIFNYMKVLDPGSVVRESEFATAAASGSLGDRFTAVGKKLLSGERLADSVRADFVDRARRLAEPKRIAHDKAMEFFAKEGELFNIPDSLISRDFTTDVNAPTLADRIQDARNQNFTDGEILGQIRDTADVELKDKIDEMLTTTDVEPTGILEFLEDFTSDFGAGGGVNPVSGVSTQDRNVMRTDRHNNPTAFTTDIAKQAGLVEGVDYVAGDSFPNNPNFVTASLLKDPIDTTIKVLDTIGFFTQSRMPRWIHTAIAKPIWDSFTKSEKVATVKDMYQKEGNQGLLNKFFT